MTLFNRRDVLGSTVGAATLLAGCSESSSSGSFTKTAVEDQQLVVEFEDSLEAESISVVDPDGESFAETGVSAGVSRVTFDIGMPYAPGEYRIVAADGDEAIAETTQVIQPEIGVAEIGLGTDQSEELPDDLHYPERQVFVTVENKGTGADGITRLEFSEGFPNSNVDRDGSGIFDEGSGVEEDVQKIIPGNQSVSLFSSTLPFADFETECRTEAHVVDAEIRIWTRISEERLQKEIEIHYSPGSSERSCEIDLQVVENA